MNRRRTERPREPRISFYDLRDNFNDLKRDYDDLKDEMTLKRVMLFEQQRQIAQLQDEMRQLNTENNLMKERLRRRMRTTDTVPDNECCVCYSYTETKTDCKHFVCVRCIRRLVDAECPMCRTEF